jgi:hypothetical protein
LQRIDPQRVGDVLEVRRPEIADPQIEPRLHLTVGVLRKADRAGRGEAFQSDGDIYAVAHQVAVALFDDVAEVNADAKLDPALRRHAGVALDHSVLHLDRAAHRVHDAAEFDEQPIACALDDATVVHRDRGIDEVASQRPQTSQRTILVGAGQPAEAYNIGGQDGGKFPALGRSLQLPSKLIRAPSPPRRGRASSGTIQPPDGNAYPLWKKVLVE